MQFKRTALHHALSYGNGMPAARALLRAGARLDIADLAGHTPLHYAARIGLSVEDQQELVELAVHEHQLSQVRIADWLTDPSLPN